MTKSCERCGNPYQPTSNNQRYCRGCGVMVKRERNRARYIQQHRDQATPSTDWSSIVRFTDETGKSYGQCVAEGLL